ncbi:hypothetical protein BV20DRAFT_61790 [Pilatotrama ljubarskyi]|nr:hypothetical protein BV20DRAFT_61790 [Pilatotrama ljubarskyi]
MYVCNRKSSIHFPVGVPGRASIRFMQVVSESSFKNRRNRTSESSPESCCTMRIPARCLSLGHLSKQRARSPYLACILLPRSFCRPHVSPSPCGTLTTTSSRSSRQPRCPLEFAVSTMLRSSLSCPQDSCLCTQFLDVNTTASCSDKRYSDPSPAIIARSPFPHRRRLSHVRVANRASMPAFPPVCPPVHMQPLNALRGVMQPRGHALSSHRARP